MANLDLYAKFPTELSNPDLDYSSYLNNDTTDGRLTHRKFPFANVINVKAHGALGDDVDDSTACTAAVAAAVAGDTIFFPPGGTYTIKTELIPAANDITFYGPGATIKMHQTPVGTELTALGCLIWVDAVDRIRVEGIRFEGPATGAGYAAGLSASGVGEGSVVHIQASVRSVVTRCQFIMNGTFKGGCVFVKGVGLVPSEYCQITDNYADKCDRYTVGYSNTHYTYCGNNIHLNGFHNSYDVTGNGSPATTTATLTFVDGGAGVDTITRAAGSFSADGYIAGVPIVVSGTADNNFEYTPTIVAPLTLTFATGTLVAEAAVSCSLLSATDSKGNIIENNVSLDSARMGIETFETGITTRVRDTQIKGNYIKQCANIGISGVGHRELIHNNTIINAVSFGIENGDQFATITDNKVYRTSWDVSRDISDGIIANHTDNDRDRDGSTIISGNYVGRYDRGILLQTMYGTITINGNTLINNKTRAIGAAVNSGETKNVTIANNDFYWDIATDDHAGAEALRIGIGSIGATSLIVIGNVFTFADSAGGGTQGNFPLHLVDDKVIYMGNTIVDNAVQSGGSNPQVQGIGNTPDQQIFIGNNFNTCIVNLTSCTDIVWLNNLHTGTKTAFNSTTLFPSVSHGGFGTANSAANVNAIPANSNRSMEMFDETGASIGFVALHTANW